MNEITIKSVDGTVITIKTDSKCVNVNGQQFQFTDSIQPQKSVKCRIPFQEDKYIPIIKAIRTGTGMGLAESKTIAELSAVFFVLPHLYDDFCRYVNSCGITVEKFDG